jgi:hypothetical protein
VEETGVHNREREKDNCHGQWQSTYISNKNKNYFFHLFFRDLENIAKYSRRSPYAFEPGPKIVMFRRADVENM